MTSKKSEKRSPVKSPPLAVVPKVPAVTELSPEHSAVVKKAKARHNRARDNVQFRGVTSENDRQIGLKSNMGDQAHNRLVLGDLLGSDNLGLTDQFLNQLLHVGAIGAGSEPEDQARALTASIAFVRGMDPKNPIETALLTQMFAIHNLTIEVAQKPLRAATIEGAKLWADQTNKLARTFTAQVEALAKLRNGGKQTVEVKYVDARNSQNIIADTVNTGGGGSTESFTQPHEPQRVAGLALASGVPLWCPESAGTAMPSTGDERKETVPIARG